MSIRLMSEARQLDLSMSQKLIMLLLCDNANDEGTHCFPSIRRLAHEAGCSTRTVVRIIAALGKAGVVSVVARGNQFSPNQYKVRPSAGKKIAPFDSSVWARAAEDRVSLAREHRTNTTGAQDIPNHRTIIEPSSIIDNDDVIGSDEDVEKEMRSIGKSIQEQVEEDFRDVGRKKVGSEVDPPQDAGTRTMQDPEPCGTNSKTFYTKIIKDDDVIYTEGQEVDKSPTPVKASAPTDTLPAAFKPEGLKEPSLVEPARGTSRVPSSERRDRMPKTCPDFQDVPAILASVAPKPETHSPASAPEPKDEVAFPKPYNVSMVDFYADLYKNRPTKDLQEMALKYATGNQGKAAAIILGQRQQTNQEFLAEKIDF